MRTLTMMVLGACVAAPAWAGTVEVLAQARVTDTTGVPLEGPVTLTLVLHTAASGETDVWDEQMTVTATDGYFQAVLGGHPGTDPLYDTDFDGQPRYLAVVIDGVEQGPRQLLATAAHAVVATHVVGGTVHASTMQVGADTDTCPDGSAAGTFRWNAAGNLLELCDGSDFEPVSLGD